MKIPKSTLQQIYFLFYENISKSTLKYNQLNDLIEISDQKRRFLQNLTVKYFQRAFKSFKASLISFNLRSIRCRLKCLLSNCCRIKHKLRKGCSFRPKTFSRSSDFCIGFLVFAYTFTCGKTSARTNFTSTCRGSELKANFTLFAFNSRCSGFPLYSFEILNFYLPPRFR